MTAVVLLTVAAALAVTANTKVVFQDNFIKSKGTFNPADSSSRYAFFPISATQPANDGVVTQRNSFVEITSNPYTLTESRTSGFSGVLEHVKYLVFQKTIWTISPNGKSRYTLRFSTQAFGTEKQPFGPEYVTNVQDDLRLASCGLISLDPSTFMVADFFATNTGLWAFYERLPFGRTATNNYLAFSSLKRVGNRESGTVHNVRVEYDRSAKSLTWYLEDEVVLTVDRCGHLSDDPDVKVINDLGGVAEEVEPLGFQNGFGCFTLLDMADPLNSLKKEGLVQFIAPASLYVIPKSWFDTESLTPNRLFGQGAQINVSKFTVETF